MNGKQIVGRIGHRVVLALSTVPSVRHWLEAGGLLVIFAAIAVPVGLVSGLLTITPLRDDLGTLLLFAAIALVVPSLFEEILFRAILLPNRRESPLPTQQNITLAVILSTALFVAGHPLIAWLFAPAARTLFYDGRFLLLSAVFGLFAAIAYMRSGSVWPATVMHWAVVVSWRCWFGGWIMAFGPPSGVGQ